MSFKRRKGSKRAGADLPFGRVHATQRGHGIDAEYEEVVEDTWNDDIPGPQEFGGDALPFATPNFGSSGFVSSSSSSSTTTMNPQPIKLFKPRAKIFPPTNEEIQLLAGLSASKSELKHRSFNLYWIQPVEAGIIQNFSPMPCGSTNITRIGNKVNWHSVHLRGFVYAEVRNGVSRTDMYLIWDKQPNGATATSAMLFASTGTSLMNYDYRDRFEVVIHQHWEFGYNFADLSTSPTILPIEIYKSLEGFSTTYKGTDDLIGSVATGNWLLVFVNSDDANVVDVEISPRFLFYE